MKKKWMIILVSLSLVIGLCASAMAYGGGGGDDKPQAETETKAPPPFFVPINLSPPELDTTFVMGPPPETSSVGPTQITILSNEDLGEGMAEIIGILIQDPSVQWITITAGGIFVGYASAGAGLPVYMQAVAAGTYAAATTYATRSGQPDQTGSTTYSGVKDLAVGFIPVPPPAQAGISLAIDEAVDLASQAPGLQNPGHGPGGYAPTYSR